MKTTLLIFTSLILLTTSCASRPQLYPNEKLKTVGKEASQKDIDKCIADAEEYLESSKGKQVAKGAGFGATVGAAMGAVSGVFTGNFGKSLAQGAAIGAAGGGVSSGLSPDQVKRNYVNHCLYDHGYQVIGWD